MFRGRTENNEANRNTPGTRLSARARALDGPRPSRSLGPAEAAPDSLNLRVTKDFWPEFHPGDGGSEGVGQLSIDFTDSSQKRWARSENMGGEFGRSIFP